MYIEAVDPQDEKIRRELIKYLAPHETHALFILGNLQVNLQSSFIYVARQEKRFVGVLGFYPTFKSCSIFAENEKASQELAKTALQKHDITALLGIKKIIKPAYEEFLKHGKTSIGDPEALFFELQMKDFKPYTSQEGKIRPIEEKDVDAAVVLLRQIHHTPKEKPITEEERAKVFSIPVKFCMEIDGKIVTVASSNGLAIKAFQILGVATDPLYQKRGFAKAVCSHLISYMQARGADKVIIFTGEKNIAAKKCYLDLGFKITDKYYVALF
jgi:predicted GNAT family acetyltransferase